MVKKVLLALFFIIATLLAINFDLVVYGISQAKGQLTIVSNDRPIAEVLDDPDFPDSLKVNLRIIEEIKKFAFDSLGLKHSKNYSSVYDQKGKELMFVVTACEPLLLRSKEWTFPLIGSFSYKGFFDEKKAIKLENELKKEGFDTNIRSAGGWSTLGWFEDPILSNMLASSEADFAELIIHELTHGTLFVKDSLRFNENLATFIGIKGTERYLSAKYGIGNDALVTYQQQWNDRNKLTGHILKGAYYLDSVYNAMEMEMTMEMRLEIKEKSINSIINSIDTLDLVSKQKYLNYYRKLKPNNTFFMSYLRYRGDYSLLEAELIDTYQADIKKMLEDYNTKYPSL